MLTGRARPSARAALRAADEARAKRSAPCAHRRSAAPPRTARARLRLRRGRASRRRVARAPPPAREAGAPRAPRRRLALAAAPRRLDGPSWSRDGAPTPRGGAEGRAAEAVERSSAAATRGGGARGGGGAVRGARRAREMRGGGAPPPGVQVRATKLNRGCGGRAAPRWQCRPAHRQSRAATRRRLRGGARTPHSSGPDDTTCRVVAAAARRHASRPISEPISGRSRRSPEPLRRLGCTRRVVRGARGADVLAFIGWRRRSNPTLLQALGAELRSVPGGAPAREGVQGTQALRGGAPSLTSRWRGGGAGSSLPPRPHARA